ncbi:Hypothetical_protein [Hexamita inflata]|uniref:Hypothetical_protein n=1 Tax=Hexamita inflata TaxID=28002 RepID=A0AA86R436_9EUKA|nr:Hypothetical protein HINF_LOCUS53407 [Hexamita inflata]
MLKLEGQEIWIQIQILNCGFFCDIAAQEVENDICCRNLHVQFIQRYMGLLKSSQRQNAGQIRVDLLNLKIKLFGQEQTEFVRSYILSDVQLSMCIFLYALVAQNHYLVLFQLLKNMFNGTVIELHLIITDSSKIICCLILLLKLRFAQHLTALSMLKQLKNSWSSCFINLKHGMTQYSHVYSVSKTLHK